MNVIVIACNGLHLGFLGTYGNPWIETPNLDRFASEGVVFDQHFPENLTTLPTRRTWWTGRYGFADPDSGWVPLRPDESVLPDILWSQGVRTALISDVPMLREAGHGFGRGFDEVKWIRGQGYDPYIPPTDPRAGRVRLADEPGLRLPPIDDPDRELWTARWEQLLRNRAALDSRTEENTGVARTVDAAIDWLDRNASEPGPFCLWLDLFSPHGPWDLPESYRDMYSSVDPDEFETGEEGDLIEEDDDEEETLDEVVALIDVPAGAVGDVIDELELLRLRRTYAGAVSLLDAQLGLLFEALRIQGRMDDTLVIFTADQGEPLGEHGYVRRFRPWLYEELIHTPLIVRMPGAKHGGSRQPALVQAVDILPTIIAALGLPPVETAHGHSLFPLIRGERSKLRDYACLGMDVEEFAIRTLEWHMILPIEPDPDDPPRGPELYRKPEDRWDQNNVAAENPDVAEQLELALRRFVEALNRDDLEALPPLRDLSRFAES
jgi:arylsulfatase A-like enzyme